MYDYREYDSILENCKDENEVQKYLEKHSELLPVDNWILGHYVHCSFIITKFKLGNEHVTDFVYLTKCSDEWYVVFVEIENPKKKIFTSKKHFTKEFNHAYEQVEDWERYLNDSHNTINVLRALKALRNPCIMRDENVSFKFLLIYGRSGEKSGDPVLMNKFRQKKTKSIKVCTYDTIKGVTRDKYRFMVLSPSGNDKYKIKYVPDKFDCYDQGFFAYSSPNNIEINNENIEKLKSMGYDIDSWLNGKRLSFNNKYTTDNLCDSKSIFDIGRIK